MLSSLGKYHAGNIRQCGASLQMSEDPVTGGERGRKSRGKVLRLKIEQLLILVGKATKSASNMVDTGSIPRASCLQLIRAQCSRGYSVVTGHALTTTQICMLRVHGVLGVDSVWKYVQPTQETAPGFHVCTFARWSACTFVCFPCLSMTHLDHVRSTKYKDLRSILEPLSGSNGHHHSEFVYDGFRWFILVANKTTEYGERNTENTTHDGPCPRAFAGERSCRSWRQTYGVTLRATPVDAKVLRTYVRLGLYLPSPWNGLGQEALYSNSTGWKRLFLED